MSTVRLGKDAVAYYHTTPGTALSGMSLIFSAVKDIQINMGAGSAKVTTRANNGWEVELSTLKKMEVTAKIPLDNTDPAYQAITNAFLNSTNVAMAFLTDTKTNAGAEGPVGDFSIAKMDRNEPIDGEVEVNVTFKLAKFTAWNRTGGASQLAFTTQPSSSATSGSAFAQQPVVTIQDGTGATITTGSDATVVVTLALTTGAGTLGGTVSKAAVAGVADFTGLGVKITGAGAGQIITAVATLSSGTKYVASTNITVS